MAEELQVVLEIGPRGKRVVAVAPEWPGLERGAKTEEAALARLREYLPRYAPIAQRAGMQARFAAIAAPTTACTVVERYPGTGSTDFWGISFACSQFDQRAISRGELDRDLTLLHACWAHFDDVRARVSEQLRKGPRGGGRDRERIVRHVLATEQDWAATKLGLRAPDGTLLTVDGLRAHREAYHAAICALHAQGKAARSWPLCYLIRHTAFHTLDHAWEMEDKDLTAERA